VMFGSRVPRLVIGLIIVVAAVEGAYIGVSYLLTPWARVNNGHPPLVGYWQGEMRIEPGETRKVVLHLRPFRTVREFLLRGSQEIGETRTPDLRAAATVCGSNGSARYRGSGDVANRDGTRFAFGLTPDGEALGRHPDHIEGIWDGQDRLDLITRLYTSGPDGARGEASVAAVPGTADDSGVIRFEMRRISEQAFDAAC
jgi:hypothetical protein